MRDIDEGASDDISRAAKTHGIPVEVSRAFYELGQAQRAAPEEIMLRVQHFNGGGVLNVVVEHGGDVINRMSGHLFLMSAGYDMVMEKVPRVLALLKHPYGFDREYSENSEHNAEYRGLSIQEFQNKLDELLSAYGQAHSELRVYNAAQWTARQASVEVGKQNWQMAALYYQKLKSMFSSRESYLRHALQYEMSGDQVLEYGPRGYQ